MPPKTVCSFCAIPYIRGRMKSRPLEEIVAEALILKAKGIKEIALVSQDPMHYGCDIKNGPDMVKLMHALDNMGFYSIKVLYMYPEEITDEELRFIKNSKTIDPYFDVPIQTASNKMLRLMNRHGTVEEMKVLFRKIKAMMPNAVLRTTLISGFPGETKTEHEETVRFLEEIPFDIPEEKAEETVAEEAASESELPLPEQAAEDSPADDAGDEPG